MVYFITVLRALAACIITNSHYTGIYPTDAIANGGLLGDVIFFAVSGYCLYNIRSKFFEWYKKRLWRVFLPVWLITVVYMILGYYKLAEHTIVWWYCYPTYYHFVASIIVLYVPFYYVVTIDFLKNNLLKVMGWVGLVAYIFYVTLYDKSYYHIDNVREPMIRFLFFESMLLGAWFKQNDSGLRNRFHIFMIPATAFFVVAYLVSKIGFSRNLIMQEFQIINQLAIFCLLYIIFRLFCGIDRILNNLPVQIKKIIEFISNMTLEIYVVQYVLLGIIRYDIFPINWILLTFSIFFNAYILHNICKKIYETADVFW